MRVLNARRGPADALRVSERAEVLVDEFLSRLPWRRPRPSLVTPLVELLLEDDLLFWDVAQDDDPRTYAAFFVVFTPTRVITHRVEHRRGDRRAVLRTEVALRTELVEVTSSMQPETPYTWLMALCDGALDVLGPLGRGLDAACAWLARRSAWFERRCYSLEHLEAPRRRFVDVRYSRFPEPIRLPLQWDDVAHERNHEFDSFLPVLLTDLP